MACKPAALPVRARRIGLEKPLGTDLASSKVINDAVSAAFPEDRIFRIDHYLGKETVQNLLALRFANIMFEPLWNAAHIEHVQITVAETVGLEGRVAFYDDAGALRDMVQNHMLQLARAGRDGAAGFLRCRPMCATKRSKSCARCARCGRRRNRHRAIPCRRHRRTGRSGL